MSDDERQECEEFVEGIELIGILETRAQTVRVRHALSELVKFDYCHEVERYKDGLGFLNVLGDTQFRGYTKHCRGPVR